MPATEDTSVAKLPSAIAMVVVGMAALGLQPVLVSTLISKCHLSADTAGYIAACEAFGLTATNTMAIFVGSKFDWRRMCTLGLILTIVGNLGCLLSYSGVSLGAFRLIAGLGEGIVVSRGYAVASVVKEPGRVFGYLLAASTAQCTIATLVIPILCMHLGAGVLFCYLAALGLCGLAFRRGIPHAGQPAAARELSAGSLGERAYALGCAATLFLGLGMLWAYLFQIGVDAGLSETTVTLALTLSQLAAFVGSLMAATLVRWFSPTILLVASLLATIASIVALQMTVTAGVYTLGTASFNGASTMAMPLAIAAVASADNRTALVVAAAALQTAGFAFGPASAAAIVGHGGYGVVEIASISLLVASIVLGLLAAYRRRYRQSLQLSLETPR